ncbi:MAG: peptidase S45 penicillin amidase [Ignavibacteria bacterium]|nr:MAG: peptidase S45 penicillin amidase [Ignavibacteria bacterium]KAF0159869.1 MAG: peptidase S45 penicillin amidase [Ignavibacteria bacterium]
MQNWKKITIGLSVSLLIILTVLSGITFFMLKNTLPKYDDEKNLSGISAEVKIFRDKWGIPMIKAENDEDAAFALGFVHAQDRLFQMDVARRAGEGRLSEIFGTQTIDVDIMFRTVGIYKAAKESFPKLNPLSQKILVAYSNGVNEYLKAAKGNYTPEIDVLGYDPYTWEPEHSLVIAKLMGWELNISWWTDLMFSHLIQKFGETKARELIPDFPQNAPTIIPFGLQSLSSITRGLIDVDKSYREFTGFRGTHIGSNNWVVNGNKAVSGKSMIANDPHLAFTAPGRWYFAMIRSKEWNVEGFTLAGLPAVVIGKNQNISWAMTNVMADDADFYAEKIDSSGTKYFVDGKWRELAITKDTIHVKDSLNVVYEIKKTHRGAIVSDIHQLRKYYPNIEVETATLSMRWTGQDFSDEMFAALSLNKAKNWEDFKEALSYFTLPGQNFVYADAFGNIGYVCAAKLPIRANNSPTLVFDGTSSASDWKGFVPYDEMPKLFNPPQNYIASANNKIVNGFPYHISNIWEPSSRIERIAELLTSKEKHSVSDFKKYQNDFVSPFAKKITKHLISAFKDVKLHDKNLKTALDLLENWDGEMSIRSQAPTIYAFFLKNLIKNVIGDEMSNDLLKEYVFAANILYRKIEELMQSDSSLFDDVKTQAIETKDDMLRKSLADALSELERDYGTEVYNWQWGEIHKVTFKHIFGGKFSLLDKLINIGPFEIGGDGTTVFNTEYSFSELYETEHNSNLPHRTKKFENKLGPTMRYIYDYSQPDYFYFILPAGQSGHFMSDHYKDMTKMWLKGNYLRLPLKESEFIQNTESTLTLLPK